MVSFQDELRAKQGQIMGQIINDGARQMQIRLVAEVEKVKATIPGARVLLPPGGGVAGGPKSFESAARKVYGEKLKGDWLKIRDMARCTLVVQNAIEVDKALRALEAHFRPSMGFSIEDNEVDGKDGGRQSRVILGNSNEAGYSGWTINVSQGGHKGEIQVNTPVMMYAKSLPEFRDAFPDLEAKMKATYSYVPGGLGHILYETWRDKATPPAQKKSYGAASKYYYNYFRSEPPNMNWGIFARDAIAALVPPINPAHI